MTLQEAKQLILDFISPVDASKALKLARAYEVLVNAEWAEYEMKNGLSAMTDPPDIGDLT